MATVEFSLDPVVANTVEPAPARRPKAEKPLGPRVHRVRTVRLQQGVSLRTVARHTGIDVRRLRIQEQETTDLTLSDLARWQKALGVPLSELLVEPDSELSQPIKQRAKLVRAMKTAGAIKETAQSSRVSRMAEMLVDQLVEIMPELEDISPWHTYGQRRQQDELGRVYEQRISDDLLRE